MELQTVLSPLLEKHLACYGRAAVFLDWCSLPQHPRNEVDEISFRHALGEIYLWYAHAFVHVWIFSGSHLTAKSYDKRGWPLFERALTTLDVETSRVFDLRAMGSDDLKALEYF